MTFRSISILFWISLAALLLLCASVFWIPNVRNYLLHLVRLTPHDPLYATGAQSIATVLAISMSISLFTVQHSASNYAPSILKDFVKDIETWIVFSFLSFTVLFDVLALISDWGELGALYSVVFMFFSIVFLLFQFVHTSILISPVNVIEKISSRVLRDIKKIPYQLEQRIEKLPKDDIRRRNEPSEFYRSFLMQKDGLIQVNIKKSMSQIVDLIQRAGERREREIHFRGMDEISDIMRSYFEVCGEYIIDTDQFTEHVLEQLASFAQVSIRNRDSFFLIETIKVLGRIGVDASRIRVVSMFYKTPNLVSLVVYHVEQIAVKAKEAELWDSCAQSIRAMRDIGESSINKYKDDALALRRIVDIANACLIKDWFVPRIAAEALSSLFYNSIRNMVQDATLELDMERIEKFVGNVIGVLSPRTSKNVLLPLYAPTSRGVFPYNFVRTVISSLEIKNAEYPTIETHYREEYLKKIVQNIIEHLRRFGMKVAEKEHWLVYHDIADSLSEIGQVCIEERFLTFDNHFEEELLGIADSLKMMYSMAKSTIDKRYTVPIDIPDTLTILGFESLQGRQFRLASAILNYLFAMCESDANREERHDSINLANRIQMLAIYAFQEEQKEITKLALQKLRNFDSQADAFAEERPPRLSISEHAQELKEFKSESSRIGYFRPSSKEWFYSHISEDSLMKYKEFLAS